MPDNNQMGPGGLGQGGRTQPPRGPVRRRQLYVYTLVLIAFVVYLSYTAFGALAPKSAVDRLATNEFVTAVKESRVRSVTFKTSDGSLSGTYQRDSDDSPTVDFSSTYVGADSLQELMARHPDVSFRIDTSSDDLWQTVLVSVVPTVIVVLGSCVFRVIWVYTIFAHFHTIPSLYLLYPCSWMLTALAEIVYFVHCYKQAMKIFREPVPASL